MQAKQNVLPSEQIDQSRSHVLFVEGRGLDAIDPTVLKELFRGQIDVQPLGASFHVASAAQALHQHHPSYYFLIDRDHHDDTYVEQCWRNFPDPRKSNLLVWRRREIESYFLIPEYLMKSPHLKKGKSAADLRKLILRECRKRLFMDVANQVIVEVRESLKEKWIEVFKKDGGLKTAQDALAQLEARAEFAEQKKRVSHACGKKEIRTRFHATLAEWTGGKRPVEFGTGSWFDRVAAKGVLNTVVNQCFTVRDARGGYVRGKRKLAEVVLSLVRLDLAEQPDDFRELHRLVTAQTGSPFVE